MKDPKDEIAEKEAEEARLKNPCPKCPKGEGCLYPSDDISEMTEEQLAHYLAGDNRQFTCDGCGYQEERNVDVFEGIPEEEGLFKFDDRINPETFEDLICRAIEKRCFIEVLSLVHNTIELYLKYRIRLDLFKLEGLDNFGFDLLRYKKNDGGTAVGLSLDETDNEKRAKKKFGLLFGEKVYLTEYAKRCFVLNLIDEDTLRDISNFNGVRNLAMHELLREDKSRKKDIKYSQIKAAAKLGRKIQLKLSPLNHSDQDIENILKKFDISDEEAKEDKFLKGSRS